MNLTRLRLIVLALGVLAAFSLLGMSCTDQDYAGPQDAPKMYVVGDSITNGSTAELNAQFQPAYRVKIDGWSGASSKKMAPIAQDVAPSTPDVVVVELGTNDPLAYALDESELWLQTIYGSFPSARCVVVVTPWSGTLNRPAGSLSAIAAFERATFPHVADWDAAVTPDDYVGGDGIHPNSAGRLKLTQVEAAAIATCPPPPTTTSTSDSTTSTSDSTTSSTEETTTTTEVPTSTTEVPTSTTEVPTSTTEVPTSTTSTEDPTTSTTDSTTPPTDSTTTP